MSQKQQNKQPSPDSSFANQAFIALGSNLDNPIAQVQQAINEIAALPNTQLLLASSLYRSAPIGRINQPDFINAVVQVKTNFAPYALLNALLAIEQQHGRQRESINAPRTLDLDVLMYNDLQYHDDGLTIPHPRISQRAFVLQPLLEIAPACTIPGHGTAANLLTSCSEQRLHRIT